MRVEDPILSMVAMRGSALRRTDAERAASPLNSSSVDSRARSGDEIGRVSVLTLPEHLPV